MSDAILKAKSLFFALFLVICALSQAQAQAGELKMAVTTSFENSGLSEVLLPEIEKDTGMVVRLIVVGTGQALKLGRAGDVDAILVHSKAAEQEFVKQGYAPHRREIMYNDFVFVGPASDPAGIAKAKSAVDALQRIQQTKSLFVSRGDDSGTHRKELALWQEAGLDVTGFDASWYRAAGAGMGATLNTASAMDAYVFTDRASWLYFSNKDMLKLLYPGDPALLNRYAFLPVSKQKFPHVKAALAQKLENWLTSKKAQNLIGNYTINGEKLFTPVARPE